MSSACTLNMLHGAAEALAFCHPLGPFVVALVVWLRNDALVAAGVLGRAPNEAFVCLCEVTIVLLNPQVPQRGAPKQVLGNSVHIEVRIWIVRVLLDVIGCSWRPRPFSWEEFGRRPNDWTG